MSQPRGRLAADIDGQKHGPAPEGVLHGAVHIIIHSGDELRAQQRACEGEYPAEHTETSAHQLSSSLRSCSGSQPRLPNFTL